MANKELPKALFRFTRSRKKKKGNAPVFVRRRGMWFQSLTDRSQRMETTVNRDWQESLKLLLEPIVLAYVCILASYRSVGIVERFGVVCCCFSRSEYTPQWPRIPSPFYRHNNAQFDFSSHQEEKSVSGAIAHLSPIIWGDMWSSFSLPPFLSISHSAFIKDVTTRILSQLHSVILEQSLTQRLWRME